MDNKNNDKEMSFTFVGKPIIEELVNEKKRLWIMKKNIKK